MNGLIGRKVGTTHIFSEKGDEIPVTVLEMGPCPVVQVKTLEKDGYSAAQLAFEPLGKKSEKVSSKPVAGHYAKGGVSPHCPAFPSCGQEVERAIRDSHSQTDNRYRGAITKHGRCADEAGSFIRR